MVITVYADRRSSDIADIAARLAHAVASLVGDGDVILLGPRLLDEQRLNGFAKEAFGDASTPGDVGGLLADLAQRYRVAIVAASGAPTEQVVAAFDASDRVLLVSDSSVASIRGTQRALKLCASLGYGSDKTAVVLHDFDDARLAPAEAALALKREIYWTLPGAAVPDADRSTSYELLATRLIEQT